MLVTRLILILIVVGVTIYVSYSSIDMKEEGVDGIVDETFIWTQAWNDYFQDTDHRNVLLIICSLFMDVLQLAQLIRFTFWGTTWRMPFAIIPFYGVRAIVQAIIILQFPEGYNWGYPGFFSPFVPYNETADFFYSGHVGVCIIHFLEFRACGWYFWSWYAIFTMILQIVLMLCLRAHYCIDMIAGAIIAHYFFILSEKYVYYWDHYVFGIPLEKRMATK